MKTKNDFGKKLVLKRKSTIADLLDKKLDEVKGGITLTCNCPTIACTVYVSACPQCDTVLCN